MGKNFRTTVDYRSLFEGLDAYSDAVQKALREGAREVSMDGLGRMMAGAPVLTGHLRGSHSAFVNEQLAQAGDGSGVGSPNASSPGSVKNIFDCTVIVWGCNTNYAASRHENPAPGSKGGAGKWMENVLKIHHRRWMFHISKRVHADNLKGGGKS